MKTREYNNYNVVNGYFIPANDDCACTLLICGSCKYPIGYIDSTPRTIHVGRGVKYSGTWIPDKAVYSGSLTCPHCGYVIPATIRADSIADCC